MPYKRKYGKMSFRKRKRKSSSFRKKYTVSIGKLVSKKIDTLYEIRSKEIAEQVLKGARVMLCERQFLWGDYSRALNEYGVGNLITWEGSCEAMHRIRKGDSALVANPAQADDPDTRMVNEQLEAALDGTYVSSPVISQHGRRNGQFVLVTGGSLDIRMKLPAITQNIFKRVKVYFSIVQVTEDWETLTTQGTIPVEPIARQLLTVRPWGYSGLRDDDLVFRNLTQKFNRKTLCSGMKTLRYSQLDCDLKFSKISFSFKKPKKLEFALLDQTGERTVKYRFYAVVRTEIPDSFGAGGQAEQIPQIHCVSKLNYFEE